MVRNATQLISEDVVILTHSYSSSVRDVLVAAWESHPGIRVIATESRPMCEGVTLAEELARAGIEVTLIVDSAMLRGIEKAGVVLVGADSVSTGGLTNKTGTSLLAEAARTRDVPFFAACGSEKFLPKGCPEPKEPPKPAAEITRVTAPASRWRTTTLTALLWIGSPASSPRTVFSRRRRSANSSETPSSTLHWARSHDARSFLRVPRLCWRERY